MKISVDLQDPYAYMPVWIILGLALVATAVLAFFLVHRRLRDRLREEKRLKVKTVRPESLPRIKTKYVGMLDKIAWEARSGQITTREAYQRTSRTIRLFTHKVTGVRVQHCTLSEIRELNLPLLTALVAEYYEPEFARDTQADVDLSIQKTKGMIELWH